MQPRRTQWPALLLLALVFCAACVASGQQAQTPFMKAVPGVTMSTNELRARMLELGRSFTGELGEAALAIRDQSDNPEIKTNAILWAVNAVPVAHEAVLNLDPLVALADTLALTYQMQNFFTVGHGKSVFGAQQPIALAAILRLHEAVTATAQLVFEGNEHEDPKAFLAAWATDNPIESMMFFRPSASTSFPKAFSETRRGLGGVIGNTEDKLTVMSQRLALANEFLLRQVRWTAGLVVDETLGSQDLKVVLPSLVATSRAAAKLMQDLPALIAHERRAVMQAIAQEREAVMNDINRQRIETLAMLDSERQSLTTFANQQREAATQDVRDMLKGGSKEAHALVDQMFWRALILVALVGAALLVGALVVALLLRKKA